MPEVKKVLVEKCVVNDDFNTRKMGPGDLTDLTESIKVKGILEPILGKDKGKGGEVEIYAGFRRLAAAKLAGLTSVPVLVRPRRSVTRQQMLEYNVVENVHRENLNSVDEAYAYQRMQEDHKMGVPEICASIGVKKARVEQRMRLLKLQQIVRDAVHEERISMVSAFEIDRLPVEKQAKYVSVAEDLSGQRLVAMINQELDKLQKKVPGTKKDAPDDGEGDDKPPVAQTVEHVRVIKQASAVICAGLGYDKERTAEVKKVDFRPLEDDHLTVVARFFDDCADQVEEDITINEKAQREVIEFVEGDQGGKYLDMEAPIVRGALISAIMQRAKEVALENAAGKDIRPKITYALIKGILDEFFVEEEE